MMSKDFDMATFEVQGSTGLDAYFARDPSIVTPVGSRRKIATLQDLSGFVRVSNETLIHRADRDLWAISRQEDGTMFVERQFDDNGTPLKV
jgi:hypothetical protein